MSAFGVFGLGGSGGSYSLESFASSFCETSLSVSLSGISLDFVPPSLSNLRALAGGAMIGSELLSDSSSQSDWTIGLFFGWPVVILTDLAGIYKDGKKPQE